MKMRLASLLALGASLLAGCGGDPSQDDQGGEDEGELGTAAVTIEYRDDGDLHATGLHGEPGEAWDRFLQRGERVRVRNTSSQSLVFVVESDQEFADGRPHLALFDKRELLHRKLRAHRGSFSFTVSSRARFINLSAFADESESRSVLEHMVAEPDGDRHFGTSLRVERP